MIGVIGKDGACPPQLFGQHRPGHQMRPGGLAKGDRQIGTGFFFGCQSIGGTDQEADFPDPLIAPVTNLIGKRNRPHLAAGFVQCDDFGGSGQGRNLTALVREFGYADRPVDPLYIAVD